MSKCFSNQKGIAPLLILVIIGALLGFIVISNSASFKNQLFSSLFPKSPSEASTGVSSWPDQRFANAGGASVAPYDGAFYYNWDSVTNVDCNTDCSNILWLSQKQAAPNHQFAWMVGRPTDPILKQIGQEDQNCNGGSCQENAREKGCDINCAKATFRSDKQRIVALLTDTQKGSLNRGGTWIVGNEANNYKSWQIYFDPNDLAEEFSWYYDFIKHGQDDVDHISYQGLDGSRFGGDQNAKLANSGVLYYAQANGSYTCNQACPGKDQNPETYLGKFLKRLRDKSPSNPTYYYPDIFNFHTYPFTESEVMKVINNNSNAQVFKDVDSFYNFVQTNAPGKPIWLTEFSANWSGTNTDQQKQFMDNLITKKFINEGKVQRWFWYKGRCSASSACSDQLNSDPWSIILTDDHGSYITGTGQEYLKLAQQYGPPPTPTPTPAPIPVTISGKLINKITNQPMGSGTTLETCPTNGRANPTVDGNGNFSFTVNIGDNFCLRPQVDGYLATAVNAVNPNSPTYEGQVAGVAAGGNDRSSDSGYDFTLLPNAQVQANLIPPNGTTSSAVKIGTGVGGNNTVNVTWSQNPSAQLKDWVGLYRVGSADNQYLDWFYTSNPTCQKNAGSQPASQGHCQFHLTGQQTGTMEVRYFANDGFIKLRTSRQFIVTALNLSRNSNNNLVVAWQGNPAPNSRDWLGIYKPGSDDKTGYLDWVYTSSCTRIPTTNARENGSCTLPVPAGGSGQIEVRYFQDDLPGDNPYRKIGVSNSLTVFSPAGVNAFLRFDGKIVVYWWGETNPTQRDWLGIYLSSETDNHKYLDWVYTNTAKDCTRNRSNNPALSTGTCVFDLPTHTYSWDSTTRQPILTGNLDLTGRTIEIRYMANDNYVLLGKSQPFFVSNLRFSLGNNNQLIAGWRGDIGATPQDWIGIYKVGADDRDYLDWVYISSCTKNADSTKRLVAGTCTLKYPYQSVINRQQVGLDQSIELRYFRNDGFTKLGTSNSGVIYKSGSTVNVKIGADNRSLDITFADTSIPTKGDWVGLYYKGKNDQQYIYWVYTNDCQRNIVTNSDGTKGNGTTTTRSSGTCNLPFSSIVQLPNNQPVNLRGQTIEVRYLANDDFIKLAIGNSVTIPQ